MKIPSNFPNTKMTQRGTIYVDESGNPGVKSVEHNKKHPFFIIGFCYCANPRPLNKKLYKLLLEFQKKDIYPSRLKEIKFNPTQSLKKLGYSSEEIKSKWVSHYSTVRHETAKVILNNCDGIFAGFLKKTTDMHKTWRSSKIMGDSLFRRSLLEYVLPGINRSDNFTIVHDRGRLSPEKTRIFNQCMLLIDSTLSDTNSKIYSGNISDFYDVDSVKRPGIWASDFVAGAFHMSLKHDDPTYRDLLERKFIGKGYMQLKL